MLDILLVEDVVALVAVVLVALGLALHLVLVVLGVLLLLIVSIEEPRLVGFLELGGGLVHALLPLLVPLGLQLQLLHLLELGIVEAATRHVAVSVECVFLVLNLSGHLTRVVVLLLPHGGIFVVGVQVHVFEVGPGLLRLLVTRLLKLVATVQPLSLIAHEPAVLVSGVLILFLILLSGVRLNIFVVLLADAVGLAIVVELLLARALEVISACHIALVDLLLEVFLVLALLPLECLLARCLFPIVHALLDAGLLSDLELAVPDILVLFDAACLILADFAAQVHLVVGLFGREHFIFGT